jgi:DNA-binding PadR family transcriptional regulator
MSSNQHDHDDDRDHRPDPEQDHEHHDHDGPHGDHCGGHRGGHHGGHSRPQGGGREGRGPGFGFGPGFSFGSGFGGFGPGGGGPWGGGPGRPGPPPWVSELVRAFGGPGVGPDFGGGRRRGQRARRGDVRAAILDVLAGDEMNGYQLIQQISERTGGAWKPSPGSVYPTVQQLEDEGLVEGTEGAGRRLLRLSEEGRAYVEAHPDELAATWRPFEQPETEEGPGDLKPVIGQVMGAVWQVVVSGTKQQKAEAAEILADTRRKLYGILADAADGDDGDDEADVS